MKRSYIEISKPINQDEEIINIIKKIEQEYYLLLLNYNNNDLRNI